MLIEREFTLNHSFTLSNDLIILVWKSPGVGLFTIVLVSSANKEVYFCHLWFTANR